MNGITQLANCMTHEVAVYIIADDLLMYISLCITDIHVSIVEPLFEVQYLI